ncbi:MAG: type I-U CRISPR-associated protein Csx17, partial [Candidatus Eisenbacteria bacterium]|nr:type I-U CRISPR-associated protein Csx17 [Candidatus Eisenbacteria bacterium]
TALFCEGRAQLGRSSARRPLDFARAIAKLGVARGLSGFVRYGYLERNGQSNLAVPLGTLEVAAHPRARLIDEIAVWLERLQRAAEDSPARLSSAVGQLADAAFNVLTSEADAGRWQELLAAVDQVQRVQASGTAFEIGPCPRLSREWLNVAADNTPEWRLALALGSAARGYDREGRAVDSVRVHALPLDQKKWGRFAIGAEKRLAHDPRAVMKGRDPLGDLVALVARRFVEDSQRGGRTLPLVAARGAGARLDDLCRFMGSELDVERIVSMGRALMAIDWARVRLPTRSPEARNFHPDEAWASMRLCSLPFAVHGRAIATDPAMFRRLAAGDVAGAVELALRRLRAAGFRPPLIGATADPEVARRWAAAFAFPIEPGAAGAMADRFENPSAMENA